MTYRIGIIGGDGIGPEVTAQAVKCVDASGVSYEGVPFDLGWERYSRDGVVLRSQRDTATLADLQKYYEEHKDGYISPETYEVYHIESKNKDLLAKRAKDAKDLEAFKKLASQIDENAWTKPA